MKKKIIIVLLLSNLFAFDHECEKFIKTSEINPVIHSPAGWKREFRRHPILFNNDEKNCLLKNAYDITKYNRSIGAKI